MSKIIQIAIDPSAEGYIWGLDDLGILYYFDGDDWILKAYPPISPLEKEER